MFPPARTHMSFLIYFCSFLIRCDESNVSGKSRYCHKDHHRPELTRVVSMKRLFSFPNHTPPYSHKNSPPPYLSLHVGLLWSSGAMSRRGAGVHASTTGGLRTEGLEWPSACTSDLGVWEEWQFHQRFALNARWISSHVKLLE